MSTNQPLTSHGTHIAWVDFLRILACFLVVAAHCCDPFVGSFDGTFNFKSAVFWGSLVRPCVPPFAMISGVLLFPVTMEMGAFYSKRLKRVLIPLVVWSLVLPLLYFGYFAAGVHTASPNIVMDNTPGAPPSASFTPFSSTSTMTPRPCGTYTCWWVSTSSCPS